MANTLVAYFSVSGTTKSKARELAQKLGADITEIVPRVPYTSADLNWRNKQARSTIEMDDPKSRPEIVADTLDTSSYSTVYLGFPIWWYIAPTIVNTWLEAHDLAGKKVVLFATSGGSGFGQALEHLKTSAPYAHFVEGAVIRGAKDIEKLVALKEA